jgi:hypothetical protein
MNSEFEQYRFARIEGRKITRARLEAQFKDGITDLDELEKAIAQQLTMDPPCTPWRKVGNGANRLPGRVADGGTGVLLGASPGNTKCKP